VEVRGEPKTGQRTGGDEQGGRKEGFGGRRPEGDGEKSGGKKKDVTRRRGGGLRGRGHWRDLRRCQEGAPRKIKKIRESRITGKEKKKWSLSPSPPKEKG